ncbi:multidrug/hemolysin transport system permease protein [Ruminococcaceae bacterium YAD3003]|nr:multidrug/hemolysin transport system permease protein [Ruminococcaceae bacterium YAD3003]
MEGFIGLTRRNVKVYFKDISAVIFSLLTSIIVFALYLLFLRGTFVDAIEGTMKGLENLINKDDLDMFVNTLLLVGIIGSATITIPYNCLSTIVKDRERKVDYDVLATPVKRWQIIMSYLCAAVVSSFVMTSLLLTIGLVVLNSMGDMHMTALNVLSAYGVVFLGCLSSSALFMIVVLFFKSFSASGAFFGILSAAAGFVIGAYIPVSQFSSSVQTVCNIFPASQVCALLRNSLLNGIADQMNSSIGGVDNGIFIDALKESMTFNANVFEKALSVNTMCIYVLVFTLISLIAMVVLYTRVYKK